MTQPTPPDQIDVPSFENSIHTSVAQAVSAIPDGNTNALIIDGTYDQSNGPNFQAVWLHKINDNFEVAASGSYTGPKGVSGQVQAVLAW